MSDQSKSFGVLLGKSPEVVKQEKQDKLAAQLEEVLLKTALMRELVEGSLAAWGSICGQRCQHLEFAHNNYNFTPPPLGCTARPVVKMQDFSDFFCVC